jgi:hypothetical protein
MHVLQKVIRCAVIPLANRCEKCGADNSPMAHLLLRPRCCRPSWDRRISACDAAPREDRSLASCDRAWTAYGYLTIVRGHIFPSALGAKCLEAIDDSEIRRLIGDLRQKHTKYGWGARARFANNAGPVLRAEQLRPLKCGEAFGLVARNLAAASDNPVGHLGRANVWERAREILVGCPQVRLNGRPFAWIIAAAGRDRTRNLPPTRPTRAVAFKRLHKAVDG